MKNRQIHTPFYYCKQVLNKNYNLMNFIKTNSVHFIFILFYASVAVPCVVFSEYRLATICMLCIVLFYTNVRHLSKRKEILCQIVDKEVEVVRLISENNNLERTIKMLENRRKVAMYELRIAEAKIGFYNKHISLDKLMCIELRYSRLIRQQNKEYKCLCGVDENIDEACDKVKSMVQS